MLQEIDGQKDTSSDSPLEWQPGPTECNDLEDFFESLKLELSKIPYRKARQKGKTKLQLK